MVCVSSSSTAGSRSGTSLSLKNLVVGIISKGRARCGRISNYGGTMVATKLNQDIMSFIKLKARITAQGGETCIVT